MGEEVTPEVVLDVRAELGEGPIWDDRRDRLLFVGKLNRQKGFRVTVTTACVSPRVNRAEP